MDDALRHIQQRTVGAWLDYREADVRADRAAGRRAATADQGLLRQRFDDFRNSLAGRARASVLTLQAELKQHGDDLERQRAELRNEVEDHIGQRVIEARQQRESVLNGLEQRMGSQSSTQVDAARRLEEAERAHRSVRAEVQGRPLRRALVRTHVPILIALALIEVPVNRLAFELFFQEQPAISLALALAVGIMLVAFAHLTGLLLRRIESAAAPAQVARRVAGIVLFLLLSAAIVYMLATMRQRYIQLIESDQSSSIQEQLDRLSGQGTASTLTDVASTGLGAAGYTLLVINVGLFVFGAAASFVRFDPHPDYEQVWHAQERARRRLMRLRRRHEARRAVQLGAFDQRVAALDELMRETQGKLDDVTGRLAAVGPFWQDTLARVATTVRNRCLAFLEGARSEAAVDAGLRAPSEGDILSEISPGGAAS